MQYEDANRILQQRMQDLQAFVEGTDIKDMAGVEAVNHFKESFDNEGFTDETLEKWQEVERRKPASGWYGHSGQIGKFSESRTSAKILSGETGELKDSIYYEHTEKGVRITSPTAYGRVHQFGQQARIYGKKLFQMIARPFMGKSMMLKRNIEDKIRRELVKILKK